MRQPFSWAAPWAGLCICGLLLTVAHGQEADPSAAEASAAPPASVEEQVKQPERAESIGAKTGLRIFEREKPPGEVPNTPPNDPIAELTEETQDWLGALAALWKEWSESEAGREFRTRRMENRGMFATRAFVRQHDADRSGELSCDEVPESIQDGFVRVDADHDGQLTRGEVRRHARQARRASADPVDSVVLWTMRADAGRMTKESLQQAYDQFRQLDKDQDGQIDEDAVTTTPTEASARPSSRQTASRGLFGRRR